MKVTMHDAYATGSGIVALGCYVEPDTFRVTALVSTSKKEKWHGKWYWASDKRDYFLAAFDIGTPDDSTKYGSEGGIKFRLQNNHNDQISTFVSSTAWPSISPFPNKSVKSNTDPSHNWYWAKSEPLTIDCTKLNKLHWKFEREGRDVLQFRTRTAGMRGRSIIVKQLQWRRGKTGPSGWVESQVYHCLLEDEDCGRCESREGEGSVE